MPFTKVADPTGEVYKPYGADIIFALANYPQFFRRADGRTNLLDVLALPDAYDFFCIACQFPDTEWYGLLHYFAAER